MNEALNHMMMMRGEGGLVGGPDDTWQEEIGGRNGQDIDK